MVSQEFLPENQRKEFLILAVFHLFPKRSGSVAYEIFHQTGVRSVIQEQKKGELVKVRRGPGIGFG